jgi:hypothetical protein
MEPTVRRYVHECHANYRQRMRRADIEPWKKAELCIALRRGGVLWEDLDPEAFRRLRLPHARDYGVDVVDPGCLAFASQVKCYGPRSRITFRHFSTFTQFSRMLKVDLRFLDTTREAPVDTMVQRALEDGEATLERHDDFEYVGERGEEGAGEHCESVSKEAVADAPTRRTLRRPQADVKALVLRAGPNSLTRAQLPTGTGKTGAALALVRHYVDTAPAGVHVFFAPWVDLAHQTKAEAEAAWGLPVRLVGDGVDTGVPAGASSGGGGYLIVCVYNSADKLPEGVTYGLKIVDEAHHIENGGGARRRQIEKVPCERTLHLSATFRGQEGLDYAYPMEAAIDAGYILDYKLHFGVFDRPIADGRGKTGLTRARAAVTLVAQHIDSWRPALVYFNTTAAARHAVELFVAEGVACEAVDASTKTPEREAAKARIARGETDVVCLCGVWNESVSIHAVRTVVFADPRHSPENKIQVASRGNRLCEGKAFYRVVFPCCEADMEEASVQALIKGLLGVDPRLARAIEARDTTRLAVELVRDGGEDGPESESDEESDDVLELLYERVYDRMGTWLPNADWFERLRDLEAWLEDGGRGGTVRPKQKAADAEEKRLAEWIGHQQTNCKGGVRKNSMQSSMQSSDAVYKAWLAHVAKYAVLYMTDEERWLADRDKLEAWLHADGRDGKKRPKQGKGAADAEEKRLATWIRTQQKNCKGGVRKQIMQSSDAVYKAWLAHVAKYAVLYMTDEERWFADRDKLEAWLHADGRNGKKRPKKGKGAADAEEKRLATWIGTQQKNCKGGVRKNIMQSSDAVHAAWQAHVAKYAVLHMTDEERWLADRDKLEAWLHADGRGGAVRLKSGDCAADAEEKRLAEWIGTQQQNCKGGVRKEIMRSSNAVYAAWQAHVVQYAALYMTGEEAWFAKLAALVAWLQADGRDGQVRPNNNATDAEEKRLARWIRTQQKNCKGGGRKQIMQSSDAVHAAWQAHVAKYTALYMTDEERWLGDRDKLEAWLHADGRNGKKRPKQKAADAEEKRLASWISTQQKNCKGGVRKEIMQSSDAVHAAWLAHVTKYPALYKQV